MKYLVSMLLTIVVAISGCATMQENETLTRAAFEYGTLKVIDGDPDRAERVVDLMDDLIVIASGDATVEFLSERLRDEIDWGKLSPADTILVNAVINEVSARLQEQVGDGLLDPDQRLQVTQALGWIREAALL